MQMWMTELLMHNFNYEPKRIVRNYINLDILKERISKEKSGKRMIIFNWVWYG